MKNKKTYPEHIRCALFLFRIDRVPALPKRACLEKNVDAVNALGSCRRARAPKLNAQRTVTCLHQD